MKDDKAFKHATSKLATDAAGLNRRYSKGEIQEELNLAKTGDEPAAWRAYGMVVHNQTADEVDAELAALEASNPGTTERLMSHPQALAAWEDGEPLERVLCILNTSNP